MAAAFAMTHYFDDPFEKVHPTNKRRPVLCVPKDLLVHTGEFYLTENGELGVRPVLEEAPHQGIEYLMATGACPAEGMYPAPHYVLREDLPPNGERRLSQVRSVHSTRLERWRSEHVPRFKTAAYWKEDWLPLLVYELAWTALVGGTVAVVAYVAIPAYRWVAAGFRD